MSEEGDKISTPLINDNNKLLINTTQKNNESQCKCGEIKNNDVQVKNVSEKTQSQTPPPPAAAVVPTAKKRVRSRKNRNSENDSETFDFNSESFRRQQAQELAYYNSLKKRRLEGSTTELLYYNIVTTEREPGKRRVKARDYVIDFDDYSDGNDSDCNNDDAEYKEIGHSKENDDDDDDDDDDDY